jgi:hypothetical protein
MMATTQNTKLKGSISMYKNRARKLLFVFLASTCTSSTSRAGVVGLATLASGITTLKYAHTSLIAPQTLNFWRDIPLRLIKVGSLTAVGGTLLFLSPVFAPL